MKKIFLISLILAGILHAQTISVVPVSFKIINYKSKIYGSDVKLIKINKKYFCRDYIDLSLLKKSKYYAKHYIAKNKPICLKDVFIPVSRKINFAFGNLEIERDGEVIRETDQYIKIKNENGKIEKIYKDGRDR